MQPDAHGRAIGTCDSAESAHQHSHGHFSHSHPGHGGHGHSHAHPTLKPSVLGWAMVATLGLVIAEIVGGFLGHSVALLNDAVHNLSDVPALGISWLAMRWAERPADTEKTYGYHRAGTLAAFTNALVLVFLSLWLGYEALERLRAPVQVVESWMIWTSLAALCVNGGITLALVRGRNDLNLRSIQIVPPAHQRQRNSAVDTKRSQRRPYHPALDDLDRRAQSFQRFVTEPQRKKYQHKRVGKSSECARAVVAVR